LHVNCWCICNGRYFW